MEQASILSMAIFILDSHGIFFKLTRKESELEQKVPKSGRADSIERRKPKADVWENQERKY